MSTPATGASSAQTPSSAPVSRNSGVSQQGSANQKAGSNQGPSMLFANLLNLMGSSDATPAGTPGQDDGLAAGIDLGGALEATALVGDPGTLAEAAPAPGSKPIPAVLWEPGGTVPGQATLVAELMAQAGFANFSAQRGLGQSERLPLERMLADPPRVILAVGDARGPVPEDDRLLFHPALAALGRTARATLKVTF